MEVKRIALIPGDGIGKEVIPEGVKVLKAAAEAEGFKLEFTNFDFGADRYLRDNGHLIDDDELEELKKYDAIYLGAVGDPRVPAGVLEHGILLKLRFDLDLYLNLRPIKLFDEKYCPLKNKTTADIDFTVIRENTEDLYISAGGFLRKGTPQEIATQEMIATRFGVERAIRYAFEEARRINKKKTVALCDKSNVLTYAHNLWLRAFNEIGEEYPDIKKEHYYVDAICMKMVRSPEIFDVIVTPNMFGDIITDLGAEIQGGMGTAVSGNVNPNGISMFEPVHGSAPDIAGQGIANPIAAILSAAQMMDVLGFETASKKIEKAVIRAMEEKETTKDMGGTLNTAQAGDVIAKFVKEA
ncbi:3-isopropylmalate dehydrogenase [Haliovirga abyssi]|uniref:3-isopropylmalate dehydrogenase n=1 Tax=Haliovirga abyssi TaxID=2996794 RepID=A0AAU9DBR2_9FUSO|nr:3-isopropylmalate dehydrogenase [Haliovirga abyssi]BDU49553.1 3-isopropylmalate dehydrogenase [Haliovirga abyssi]